MTVPCAVDAAPSEWPAERNVIIMERDEVHDELAATGAQELLDSTSAAHLAYTAKDGTPRVVPAGYFWTGEEFVVATHPWQVRGVYGQQARIGITPTYARFYDFGAGRLPRTLQDYIDRDTS